MSALQGGNTAAEPFLCVRCTDALMHNADSEGLELHSLSHKTAKRQVTSIQDLSTTKLNFMNLILYLFLLNGNQNLQPKLGQVQYKLGCKTEERTSYQ
jgi:hypothetical protein